MKLNKTQGDAVKRMKSEGWTVPQLSDRFDVSKHAIVHILRGTYKYRKDKAVGCYLRKIGVGGAWYLEETRKGWYVMHGDRAVSGPYESEPAARGALP